MKSKAARRVLVTGSSRGVGAATAMAFSKNGDYVILAARNAEGLQRVKDAIEAEGGEAEMHVVDLSSRQACRDLARLCGDVDILINNAALTAGPFQSPLEPADDYWDRSFAVSFFAPLILMQELGRGMVQRGFGVVVNISSTASQAAVPLLAPYSVVKSALDALTKSAGMDLASTGVRVNSVVLGHVDTEAFAENCVDGVTPQDIAKRNAPIGRLVKREEIAGLCVYLSSEPAAAIIGAIINVDGGMMAGMYSFAGNFDTPERPN